MSIELRFQNRAFSYHHMLNIAIGSVVCKIRQADRPSKQEPVIRAAKDYLMGFFCQNLAKGLFEKDKEHIHYTANQLRDRYPHLLSLSRDNGCCVPDALLLPNNEHIDIP